MFEKLKIQNELSNPRQILTEIWNSTDMNDVIDQNLTKQLAFASSLFGLDQDKRLINLRQRLINLSDQPNTKS